MNKSIVILAIAFFTQINTAQTNKKVDDQKAIKSMCGCFEVGFNFAETFSYSKDSLHYKPSKTKYDYGLEWAELVEDQENKIVLQHILIVGKTDDAIVKHWRQDWEFENTKFYQFHKDLTWNFETKSKNDVKGQWTQRVYQVDDSPRYAGSATWLHVDGRRFWTNTTDAPLPRREHTIRSDYNVLKRTNTHEITKEGWIHNQDNEKIIRDENGKDVLLAKEKGFDTYKKVEDSKCIVAQNYWKKNALIWKKVRDKWEVIFDRDKDLKMQLPEDKQPLFTKLFALKEDTPHEEINKIIDSYIAK
jgi:hypothetical protein